MAALVLPWVAIFGILAPGTIQEALSPLHMLQKARKSTKMGPEMIEPILHDRLLECLLRNYGLTGTLQRLPGENLNLLVTTSRNRRFVLKIVGPDMPEEVVEMECAAVRHVEAVQEVAMIEIERFRQRFRFVANENSLTPFLDARQCNQALKLCHVEPHR